MAEPFFFCARFSHLRTTHHPYPSLHRVHLITFRSFCLLGPSSLLSLSLPHPDFPRPPHKNTKRPPIIIKTYCTEYSTGSFEGCSPPRWSENSPSHCRTQRTDRDMDHSTGSRHHLESNSSSHSPAPELGEIDSSKASPLLPSLSSESVLSSLNGPLSVALPTQSLPSSHVYPQGKANKVKRAAAYDNPIFSKTPFQSILGGSFR